MESRAKALNEALSEFTNQVVMFYDEMDKENRGATIEFTACVGFKKSKHEDMSDSETKYYEVTHRVKVKELSWAEFNLRRIELQHKSEQNGEHGESE